MSPPSRLALLQSDGNPLQGIGIGATGVVFRCDNTALKLPLKFSYPYTESLQHEKEVYQRLGPIHGVVRYLDLSGDGIQMELMKNGDLNGYLTRHRRTKRTQLAWFREMADALVRIHNRCVIVADIAARNFLLDADLSVKFSDFTESSVLPLGTDMEAADDGGYSIYTDIGELGAVMHEVVTGNRCRFDLFKDHPAGPSRAAWPRRVDLPSTEDNWLGSIIETCWTKGGFRNARELLTALNSVTIEQEAAVRSVRKEWLVHATSVSLQG